MTGPLASVRVVVLAGMGPVPFTAMLLADMGAQVVRLAPRFSRTPARSPAAPETGPVDVRRLLESWCSKDRYPEEESAHA